MCSRFSEQMALYRQNTAEEVEQFRKDTAADVEQLRTDTASDVAALRKMTAQDVADITQKVDAANSAVAASKSEMDTACPCDLCLSLRQFREVIRKDGLIAEAGSVVGVVRLTVEQHVVLNTVDGDLLLTHIQLTARISVDLEDRLRRKCKWVLQS